MNPNNWQSTEAWHELLAGLGELEKTFLEGDRAVDGESAVVDGYRMLTTTLGVGLDTYLYAERSRPDFIQTVTPFRRDRRWGGDNTDAWYSYAPIDPRRSYVVSGNRGDSVYFSLTVYNEPSPGAWSDRVIGVLNDSDLDFDADGNFRLLLAPERPADGEGPCIVLADDAAVAFTRDYQSDALRGRPVTWRIEAVEPPEPIVKSDAATAAALRSVLTWLRTMTAIVPTRLGERVEADRLELGHNVSEVANAFAEPYQVPDFNFGWSATDACYSFGSYDLAADEALVVTHRPPRCRFWNINIWNQFMAGHTATDGRTSINMSTAQPNADGTVTVVIARTQLDHPNAISTLGQPRGSLAFRWFLADSVPQRPVVRLVRAGDAPSDLA
ncbi:DUF1214 domain-containing protein [Pimelobacter simplex]|uniref:DUF1214 domain-containing protein n=1 Tax=Nocardioides simplex TaxID=2045 RepID=UPI001931B040|nr:DUF1214 domain-containing protein [Pimelobacter simplex]